MINLRHIACVACLFLGISGPAPADTTGSKKHLTLLTENNPPYNFKTGERGEIDGSAVKIVKELMRRTGVDYTLTMLPSARAYRKARENAGTCTFVINRTKARESSFAWVGPLIEGGWALYRRPGSTIIVHSTGDIKPYVIAGKHGSASVASLERTAHVKVLTTTNDELAAKMLYHGRADLWISGVITAPSAARAIGMPAPELALLWKKADLSLACGHGTDKALIAELNQVNQQLDDLRKKALAEYTQGLTPTP